MTFFKKLFGKETIESDIDLKHKDKLVDEVLDELNKDEPILTKKEFELILARNLRGYPTASPSH